MRCQQFELYAAEDNVSDGMVFISLDEVKLYVRGLLDSEWWGRMYPTVRGVEVGGRDAGQRDSVGAFDRGEGVGRIEMARSHWCEQAVIHELAHVFASAASGSQAHDPWFARHYLDLTYLSRGSEAFMALLFAFNIAGIEHDPA